MVCDRHNDFSGKFAFDLCDRRNSANANHAQNNQSHWIWLKRSSDIRCIEKKKFRIDNNNWDWSRMTGSFDSIPFHNVMQGNMLFWFDSVLSIPVQHGTVLWSTMLQHELNQLNYISIYGLCDRIIRKMLYIRNVRQHTCELCTQLSAFDSRKLAGCFNVSFFFLPCLAFSSSLLIFLSS